MRLRLGAREGETAALRPAEGHIQILHGLARAAFHQVVDGAGDDDGAGPVGGGVHIGLTVAIVLLATPSELLTQTQYVPRSAYCIYAMEKVALVEATNDCPERLVQYHV